jgi:GTP cyclohydrolase I
MPGKEIEMAKQTPGTTELVTKNGSSLHDSSSVQLNAAKDLSGISTQEMYAELLRRFDEDPTRDGLLKTPERAAKAMAYLTRGYRQDPKAILNDALFDVDYDEMVIVRDIEMFSLCEHHILPFFGKVHVAYIPQGKVLGLSKIPRLVDVFARRLPQGVGVVIEARHLCMMMRGVEKQHSSTVTSAMLGVFQQQPTRAEFLSLVRERSHNGV